MNKNELWLACNADGVRPLEHEGDYEETDILLHISSSVQGDPVIRIVRPEL